MSRCVTYLYVCVILFIIIMVRVYIQSTEWKLLSLAFGNRSGVRFFFLFISSSPPPSVCSHQFSGDFYKSFVAHIKRDSRVAVKDDKKYGPFAVRFFALSSCIARPHRSRRFVYFIINNIANTSSVRLRPPSFIQVSK